MALYNNPLPFHALTITSHLTTNSPVVHYIAYLS